MPGLGDKLLNDKIEADLLRWISLSPGAFSISMPIRDLGLATPEEKELAIMACEALVKKDVLDYSGARRGQYRPRKNMLERQFIGGPPEQFKPADLWLPFNVTTGEKRLVNIFPGNIITLAGDKNVGKTSVMLNIAAANRHNWNVNYFNSEMPDNELAVRTGLFQEMPPGAWDKVNFFWRSRDFADVIFGGERDLNIIDFLELTDEFWKVAQLITDIWSRLNKKAICIIAVQKKRGSDDPRGGDFALEKSRLHINISHNNSPTTPEYKNKFQIKYGKNWAQTGENALNPSGMYVLFKLINGCNLRPMYGRDGGIWFQE